MKIKYYIPIIIISLGFGLLAAQYTGDGLIGAVVGMVVSMLMINEAEKEMNDDERQKIKEN